MIIKDRTRWKHGQWVDDNIIGVTHMKDNEDGKHNHEGQQGWQDNFRTIAIAPTSRIDESFENSFGLKKWA